MFGWGRTPRPRDAAQLEDALAAARRARNREWDRLFETGPRRLGTVNHPWYRRRMAAIERLELRIERLRRELSALRRAELAESRRRGRRSQLQESA